MLYPARIWRSIGPNALILRGAFIVKINEDLHTQLHRELDNYLSEKITRESLPRKNALKHLKKEYEKQESQIRIMNPIEKLEWLENQIDTSDKRNLWLFSMLDKQLSFLIAHNEEI